MLLPGTPDGVSINDDVAMEDEDGLGGLSTAFMDDDDRENKYKETVDQQAKIIQAQIDKYQSRARAKLERYKKRIEDMKASEESLKLENEKLRMIIDNTDKKDNDLQLFALQMKQKQSKIVSYDDRRQRMRAQIRREMGEAIGQLEQIEELDNDDSEENRLFCWDNMVKGVSAIRSFLDSCAPFRRDIEIITIRYGTGMAGYFRFYRYMFVNTFLFVSIWTAVFVYQMILFGIQEGGRFWDMQGSYPQWFYFSSLVVPGVLYAGVMITTGGYLVSTSLAKLISQHRTTIFEAQHGGTGTDKRYSSVSFNVCDYKAVSRQEIDDSLQVTSLYLKSLIDGDNLMAQIAGRSRFERIRRSACKWTGLFLNILVIVISSLIVVSVYYYKAQIVTSIPIIGAEFIPPTVLAAVKTIFPIITIFITELENHDDTANLLMQQTWRLFAGKQTFVLALVAVNFNSVQTGVAYDEDVYPCAEDQVASSLFNSAVIEFFTTKIACVLIYGLKNTFRNLKCCSCLSGVMQLEEFRASEGVVDLLYFQSLVWISIPLFPFGGLLSTFFLYFNFHFEKYTLYYFRGPPRATKNLNMNFATLQVFTIFSVSLVWIWFLRSEWTCGSSMFGTETPYGVMETYVYTLQADFILWATPYIFGCVVLVVAYFLQKNYLDRKRNQLREAQETSERELQNLRETVKRQAMTLKVLKSSSKDKDSYDTKNSEELPTDQ